MGNIISNILKIIHFFNFNPERSPLGLFEPGIVFFLLKVFFVSEFIFDFDFDFDFNPFWGFIYSVSYSVWNLVTSFLTSNFGLFLAELTKF